MAAPPNLVRHLMQIMLRWSPVWLITTIATTALGLGYVMFLKQDIWVASQAMIIRDEVGGTLNRQGRFDSKEAMKAAQETILEIARNPQVVHNALSSIDAIRHKNFNEEEIQTFVSDQLVVRSPKGSEFGTTEIFYVDIRDPNKEQAVRLNKAICDALERRMQEIRMARYHGIVNELEHALEIAQEQREKATESLRKLENSVGQDLTELRGLTDSPNGSGTLKPLVDQLTSERSQAESQINQLQEDLAFLDRLQSDPSRVLVAPSNLLNSQPGLKRLCEGLVDSQLQESQLSGRFTDEHPSVKAARVALTTIRNQLGDELKLARSSVESEIRVINERLKLIDQKLKQGQERIINLTAIRADYANALAEVKNRTTIIEQIEKDLSAAEANRRAANQSSLITRLDSPVLGDKPMGPGKTTIMVAAIAAGLLSGIGIVLLFAPIDLGIRHGRRWSDHIFATHQAVQQFQPSTARPDAFSRFDGSGNKELSELNRPTTMTEPFTSTHVLSNGRSAVEDSSRLTRSIQATNQLRSSEDTLSVEKTSAANPIGFVPGGVKKNTITLPQSHDKARDFTSDMRNAASNPPSSTTGVVDRSVIGSGILSHAASSLQPITSRNEDKASQESTEAYPTSDSTPSKPIGEAVSSTSNANDRRTRPRQSPSAIFATSENAKPRQSPRVAT